jgi:hypothetical protein
MVRRDDVRAGDADRDAVAAQLREHFAAGRLTLAEFRARLDGAFAATTRGHLGTVTADLPHDGLTAGRHPGNLGNAGWRPPEQQQHAQPGAGRPRRRGRIRTRFLLALGGLTAAWLLIAFGLPHYGLLTTALLVLLGLMLVAAAVTVGLAWLAIRIWRRGAWLEALPLLAGQPWLSRVLWAGRLLWTGRTLYRLRRRFRPV